MKDIESIIKKYVEDECKKPTSKYGYEPFAFHFIPMVEYAKRLAIELDADIEIVSVAAWLHDIGSIIEGRENHHITGAKIAEKKLNELDWDKEKIEKVKKCILHHRGSFDYKRVSIEEKIIAEADSLSNFDNIGGIFKAAIMYEGLDQGRATLAVKNKLINKYNSLHFNESKKIIKPKLDAVLLLL